jgi:putative serine protease PepD
VTSPWQPQPEPSPWDPDRSRQTDRSPWGDAPGAPTRPPAATPPMAGPGAPTGPFPPYASDPPSGSGNPPGGVADPRYGVGTDERGPQHETWTPPNPPPPLAQPTRSGQSSAGTWRAVLVVVATVALLAAGFLAGRLTADADNGMAGSSTSSSEQSRPAGMPVDPPVADDVAEPVAEVAAALAPAVVQIERGTGFGLGLGSGVVYDADGLLITNQHVVGDATDVRVTMADGTTVDGEVLGTDPSSDIAVVRIPADAVLSVAVLGLDEEVRVGQTAVAIGSPFRLEQTVTSGIVSAVGRPIENQVGPDGGLLLPMIQTDAAINQGNSGGPLADRHGRVIGINTAIISSTGDSSGLGFAVPIDLAFERATRLAAGESIETALLGVLGEGTGDGRPGTRIAEVTPDSAADEAGLRVGDVVVAIDDQAVRTFGELATIVGVRLPGETIELTVQRNGETITLEATLGRR